MAKFSEKIQKQIPSFKPGDVREFRLLGLKVDRRNKTLIVPRNVMISNSDNIIDDGNLVQILCIDRELPTGPDSKKETDVFLKDLKFAHSMKGVWRLYGENQVDKRVFEHLYLSSVNRSNVGKDYHIPPKGKYRFEYIDAENAVKKAVDNKTMEIRAASSVIDMGLEDMKILGAMLQKDSSVPFVMSSSDAEATLKNKLIKVAEKFPAKVIQLSSEFRMHSRRVVEAAIKKKIIKVDTSLNQITWDNGGKICTIPTGLDAVETLANFFLQEEGKEVLRTILPQIEGKSKSNKVGV